MLAPIDQDLAVDDHLVDAGRQGYVAHAALREVLDLVLGDETELRRVEEEEVGGIAGAQEAAVAQAHEGRREEGEAVDALLQAHELLLADPVADEVGAELGAVVALQVGAAVR